jgi:hypothetical protein
MVMGVRLEEWAILVASGRYVGDQVEDFVAG